MKIRTGFVSNSSSSSFILVTAGDKTLYCDRDEESVDFECDSISLNIDKLIKDLQEAKENGAKNIDIEYGATYEG